MNTIISTENRSRKTTRALSIALALVLIISAVILPTTGSRDSNNDVAYAADSNTTSHKITVRFNAYPGSGGSAYIYTAQFELIDTSGSYKTENSINTDNLNQVLADKGSIPITLTDIYYPMTGAYHQEFDPNDWNGVNGRSNLSISHGDEHAMINGYLSSGSGVWYHGNLSGGYITTTYGYEVYSDEIISYSVTVSSEGTYPSGGGNYNPGVTVNITPGTDPSGRTFWYWSSSDVTINNIYWPTSANFTMPVGNVTVTANYMEKSPTPSFSIDDTTYINGGGTAIGYSAVKSLNADGAKQTAQWMYTKIGDATSKSDAQTKATALANSSYTALSSFTTTPTPKLDAGFYALRVYYDSWKPDETANSNTQNSSSATVAFEVKKADYAPTISMDGYTYGATPSVPVIAGYPSDYTSGGAINDCATFTYSGTSFTSEDKAETSDGSFLLPDAPVSSLTPGQDSGSIDWTSPSYSYSPKGVPYSASVPPTQAGIYSVTATIKADANFNQATTATKAWFTVSKAPYTPVLEVEDYTYGETASKEINWLSTPSSEGVSGIGAINCWIPEDHEGRSNESAFITYRYTGKAFTAGEGSTTSSAVASGLAYDENYPPTKAGIYTLTLFIDQDKNYVPEYVVSDEFKVKKAENKASVKMDGWVYGEYDKEKNVPIPSGYPSDYGEFYNATTGAVVTETAEAHTHYRYTGNEFSPEDKEILGSSPEDDNGGGIKATGLPYDSDEVPTKAGIYTVTMTVDADDNYTEQVTTDTFTVSKADYEPSVEMDSWIYGEYDEEKNVPIPSGYPADYGEFYTSGGAIVKESTEAHTHYRYT
jgi:hypothetical protein